MLIKVKARRRITAQNKFQIFTAEAMALLDFSAVIHTAVFTLEC